MKGDPTDNNATLFAQGYDAVVKAEPVVDEGRGHPGRHLGPRQPLSPSSSQAYTAHSGVNSAIIPNDENGAPIISYLKNHGIKAQHLPGHRAGRNARSAFRTSCRATSVERPTSRSTRRHSRPPQLRCSSVPARRRPSSLVNGSVANAEQPGEQEGSAVGPAQAPEWVTTKNMNCHDHQADGFSARQAALRLGSYAAECKAAGISELTQWPSDANAGGPV